MPRDAAQRTLLAVIDARRAWLSKVVGREVLTRAAETLAPAGIIPMVLKGVWLQACVYTQEESRIVTDVDLLVSERDFGRALIALERGGWRRGSGDVRGLSLHHTELHLPLDLHRCLFTRGAFRLQTDPVIERSHVDCAAFGVAVRLPDPRDALAHLVGHFVKSRMRCDDAERVRDFVVIAQRCQLDPVDSARHLHAAGMARAVRYLQHGLADTESGAFYRTVTEALPRDPLAEPLVALARMIADRGSKAGEIGALPGFLLDRSLLAGAHALFLRALDLRQEQAGG